MKIKKIRAQVKREIFFVQELCGNNISFLLRTRDKEFLKSEKKDRNIRE